MIRITQPASSEHTSTPQLLQQQAAATTAVRLRFSDLKAWLALGSLAPSSSRPPAVDDQLGLAAASWRLGSSPSSERRTRLAAGAVLRQSDAPAGCMVRRRPPQRRRTLGLGPGCACQRVDCAACVEAWNPRCVLRCSGVAVWAVLLVPLSG